MVATGVSGLRGGLPNGPAGDCEARTAATGPSVAPSPCHSVCLSPPRQRYYPSPSFLGEAVAFSLLSACFFASGDSRNAGQKRRHSFSQPRMTT
jgi:hypothetical protein